MLFRFHERIVSFIVCSAKSKLKSIWRLLVASVPFRYGEAIETGLPLEKEFRRNARYATWFGLCGKNTGKAATKD
jgi:hypothetical protein